MRIGAIHRVAIAVVGRAARDGGAGCGAVRIGGVGLVDLRRIGRKRGVARRRCGRDRLRGLLPRRGLALAPVAAASARICVAAAGVVLAVAVAAAVAAIAATAVAVSLGGGVTFCGVATGAITAATTGGAMVTVVATVAIVGAAVAESPSCLAAGSDAVPVAGSGVATPAFAEVSLATSWAAATAAALVAGVVSPASASAGAEVAPLSGLS
jgi:hypothetical protein